ncbi:LLM class F420-dependent oxidoreductase [Microbacterium amylolyticum]|uniref:F420-dependent oxidoreductase-like protein n=1 Tax=Microbacterium amylolyticum TaxID=936337 RepID=A0ABS4ZH71_9MICO|nr:LLM class F420-dependent oxidoreductase [Microbacterium amylolyticum]MBP2436629.1 F420-dependent oxidoreductase-like protein [Microbacterium amylolyticum]
MRFGTFIPQGWRFDLVGIDPSEQWATMQRLAQRADDGPWESLWVYDHFHTTPVPSEEATHEAWTLMSAFAASTSRIRLGQMCTCMGYRNPAYLAKVAATVDHVSSGRVEMGIGGGWYEHEWRAYGYGFPAIGDRLRALREGVEIMKQGWETGRATLDGRYFQVDGAIVQPQPIQQPGIPIWVAGGGEKVTLKIAATYASYTNFGSANVDEFRHKNQVLQGHCDALGRDHTEITRSTSINVVLGENQADVNDRLARITDRANRFVPESGRERFLEDIAPASPGIGTPEQVAEHLQALKEAGVDYTIAYFPELAYDTSGAELFEKQVIPALA